MTQPAPVTPLGALRGALLSVVVTVCWIVLFVGAMAGGLEIGKSLAGPLGRDGYLALTGLWAVILMPLGLASSALLLWRTRNRVLYLLSAVPIGLLIMLWPFLFSWAWD